MRKIDPSATDVFVKEPRPKSLGLDESYWSFLAGLSFARAVCKSTDAGDGLNVEASDVAGDSTD